MAESKKKNSSMLFILFHQDAELYRLESKDYTEEISIGRSSDCTWSVGHADQSASSRHAMISFRKGNFYITDLGSRNGLFLNGTRIKESKLSLGDTVQIGECVLSVSKLDSNLAKKVKPDQIRYRDSHGNIISYKLKNNETIRIGGAPDCDLRFDDPLVSAHHISITKRADGSCWIRDLKSRNGTFVNRQELASNTERMLKDCDLISIADIDLTYWDGRMSHENFRLILAVGVLVVSIVVCVLGFMLYQQFRPGALYFIQAARQEARQGNFEQAREYINQVQAAKNASKVDHELNQLVGKLAVWESTSNNWKSVCEDLDNIRFQDIPQHLGNLNLNQVSYWDWNEKDALLRMEKARDLKKVFEKLLAVDAIMRNPEGVLADLRAQKDELAEATKQLETQRDAHFDKLIEFSKTNVADAEKVIAAGNVLDAEIAKIQGKQFNASETVLFLENLNKETSPILQFRIEKMLPLFESIAQADIQLDKKKSLIRDMKFEESLRVKIAYLSKIQIPPYMEAQIAYLKENEEQLDQFAAHSKLLVDMLQNSGAQGGQDCPALKVFTEQSVMDAVFACDSLNLPMPSRRRQAPSGNYDRILGIENFYAMLRCIGTEHVVQVNYDIAFVNELEQAQGMLTDLEYLRLYVNEAGHKWILEGGKYAEYMAYLAKQVVLRDAVIALIQKRKTEPLSREYFIAHGIVYTLNPALYSEAKRSELKKEFAAFRMKLQDLGTQYSDAMPEEAMKIRTEILNMGLPGDPVVKRMWGQF